MLKIYKKKNNESKHELIIDMKQNFYKKQRMSIVTLIVIGVVAIMGILIFWFFKILSNFLDRLF